MAQLALQQVIALMTDRDGEASKARDAITAMAERAVSLERDAPDVLGYAGCALCDIGDVRRGMPLLERALELDPSNAQASAAKGASLVLQGRHEEGVEALEAAIRISPKHPALAYWLQVLRLGLEKLGRQEEARAAFERARRYDPDVLPPLLLLARILSDAGDDADARELVAEARAAEPALDRETLARYGLDFAEPAGDGAARRGPDAD